MDTFNIVKTKYSPNIFDHQLMNIINEKKAFVSPASEFQAVIISE